MTLHGWQRIWVLFAVLWAGGMSAYSYYARPLDDQIYHMWSREIIAYLIEQAPELESYTVETLRGTYSNISDKKLIDALHDNYISKHPAYQYGFAEIDGKYRDRLSNSRSNLSYWVFAGTKALGIPLVVYIAGWSVAWIRRGFRGAGQA